MVRETIYNSHRPTQTFTEYIRFFCLGDLSRQKLYVFRAEARITSRLSGIDDFGPACRGAKGLRPSSERSERVANQNSYINDRQQQ